MPRPWLFVVCLSIALAAVLLGQQAEPEELTDSERIVRLESRLTDIERALGAVAVDGSTDLAATLVENRLSRVEMRLDQLERTSLQSSGVAAASSMRMIDSRLRVLENAMMRIQR